MAFHLSALRINLIDRFCGFRPFFYAFVPLLVFSLSSQWYCISMVKNTNEGGLFCLHYRLSGWRDFADFWVCVPSANAGRIALALTSVNLWQDLSGLCLDTWELCGKIQCNQRNLIHLRFCFFCLHHGLIGWRDFADFVPLFMPYCPCWCCHQQFNGFVFRW